MSSFIDNASGAVITDNTYTSSSSSSIESSSFIPNSSSIISPSEGSSQFISSSTRYIISTSGRASSLQRYKHLLQSLLQLNIVYLPITHPCAHHPHQSIPLSHDHATNSIINPQHFVNVLISLPCIGGAISKDIKHAIVPYLDELDESAKGVDSVNTVIVRHNDTSTGDNSRGSDIRLIGYNTDVIGFQHAIQSTQAQVIAKYQRPIRTAICYGYGGVTMVVIHVLRALNIDVYLCGRRLEEATKRAKELNVKVWRSAQQAREDGDPDLVDDVDTGVVNADLFVNAAPVSNRPLHEAKHFLDALRGCVAVFDHEMPGKYLQEYCQENDIIHTSGYNMYYPQMIEQWGLFLQPYGIGKDRLRELIAQAEQMVAEGK